MPYIYIYIAASLFPTLSWVESSNLCYKSEIKQTLDQHIESGLLSSEINSSASQVDSPQAIITSPGNANAVAAAALENKDLAFLVAQLGSDSHQSNNNNNSDGHGRQKLDNKENEYRKSLSCIGM